MKRMMAALAVLTVAALGTPVCAQDSVEGTATMAANPGVGTGDCPEVVWAGSLALQGTADVDGTYGLILTSNDVEGVMRGPWYLFQENWAVTSEVPELDAEGMPVVCMPGVVLMSGWDAGVGSMERMEFWDTGFVETAAPPFTDWLSARTYQEGVMTTLEGPDGVPVPVAYEGAFRLES